VAIYHFVISIGLTIVLVAFYKMYGLAEDALIPFKVLLALAAPFVLLYFVAGWGILRQRNWGRILSLVLNWANVLAAVVNFSRFSTNPSAIINGILCCLVLWWLSKPTVKMQFRSQTATQ
jgi:hypothetical protein